jgi:uncharacterized membrane protein
MEYFTLGLSFLGWVLLAVLTFGILFVYVEPYLQATYVCYYEELLDNPIVSNSIDSLNAFTSNSGNNFFG